MTTETNKQITAIVVGAGMDQAKVIICGALDNAVEKLEKIVKTLSDKAAFPHIAYITSTANVADPDTVPKRSFPSAGSIELWVSDKETYDIIAGVFDEPAVHYELTPTKIVHRLDRDNRVKSDLVEVYDKIILDVMEDNPFAVVHGTALYINNSLLAYFPNGSDNVLTSSIARDISLRTNGQAVGMASVVGQLPGYFNTNNVYISTEIRPILTLANWGINPMQTQQIDWFNPTSFNCLMRSDGQVVIEQPGAYFGFAREPRPNMLEIPALDKLVLTKDEETLIKSFKSGNEDVLPETYMSCGYSILHYLVLEGEVGHSYFNDGNAALLDLRGKCGISVREILLHQIRCNLNKIKSLGRPSKYRKQHGVFDPTSGMRMPYGGFSQHFHGPQGGFS